VKKQYEELMKWITLFTDLSRYDPGVKCRKDIQNSNEG